MPTSMASRNQCSSKRFLFGEIGNPINMAMVSVQNNLSPQKTLQELSDSLTSMLPLVLVSYHFL
jgi:hypothetical protein